MNADIVRLIQTKLAEMGHYTAKVDGDRGPKTNAAARAGLPGLGQGTPEGFADWSGKRCAVGFLQAWAASEGIDPGPVDGWWGPQTEYAAECLEQKLSGAGIRHFLDETPETLPNPSGFPAESRGQREIRDFYGAPGVKDGREPRLVRVELPWRMKLSWNRSLSRSSLRVHEKCAESLVRVLARIEAAYSPAQREDLGIDIFSGDYNPRKMKGADRHSLHSWGIAFDFDHTRNSLHANGAEARLGQRDAIPFWEAWEAEGWYSLGRMKNYDFMHVQAAHRTY
ncbi:hypothetical protein ACQ5SO_08630 [Rhodovulum sp. DZ06]|uniref:hypothetical protein n=1 Tax=Rhodovulum sp. DZ06 TaxID=3425126 RepID=UPI003D34D8ED